MDQILENLGEFIQDEQCEYQGTEHVFSERYQNKKERLLNSVTNKRRLPMGRPVFAAASVALAVVLSGSVYAAVKLLNTTVDFDKDNYQASVSNDMKQDVYIPPIEISAKYLPEGYEEWDEGKYSYQGEYGANGLSIFDASGTKTETFQDVSDYEQQDFSNAKAYILRRDGYDYSRIVFLSFEESGHVVIIYASQDIEDEELWKVCENISITEVPEKDPDRTFKAYSYDPAAEGEALEMADLHVAEDKILGMQDTFKEIFAYTETGDTAQIQARVTEASVKDKVDLSLINEDTVYEYEKIKSFLGEDGSLPENTVVAECWDEENGRLAQKEVGVYPVKYLEVTMELENTGEEDAADVNVQPQFCNVLMGEDGTYTKVTGEDQKLPAAVENIRGCASYELSVDHLPFYFDSSAFKNSSHFFNTSLKAGEKKTVRVGFAVPEQWLDDLYLVYHQGSEENEVFVKLDTAGK